MKNRRIALSKPLYLSPEQYLLDENDNASGIRHEYVNGQAYAMVGASRGHNRIAGRFFLRLSTHLENSRCEVFQSDMKVGLQRKDDTRFYYPDFQVSCEEENDTYYNTSPCLIVEVLSESTDRKDRTEKLLAYQGISSLQEYVLCSQDTASIVVVKDGNVNALTMAKSLYWNPLILRSALTTFITFWLITNHDSFGCGNG